MPDASQPDVNHLQRFISRLKKVVHSYRQANSLQSTLYELSELSYTAKNLNEFMANAHKLIGQFLPADNLYIALERKGHLVPFYFKDDRSQIETLLKSSNSMDAGLSGYVIRTRQPLLCDSTTYEQMQTQGLIEAVGAAPVQWLGVPLLVDDRATGVLVIQSYNDQQPYNEEDKELLVYLARHTAIAMQRLDDRNHFEQRLKQHTQELLEANHALRRQVQTTKEREQRIESLYQIAHEALVCEQLEVLLPTIHSIIKQQLDAPNMYIALLNDERDELEFPYYCNETCDESSEGSMFSSEPRPLGTGLTEYVLVNGKGLIADMATRRRLMDADKIYLDRFTQKFREYGEDYLWMGVPLKLKGKTVGVLALQHYQKSHQFSQQDLDWLNFISEQVALAIERIKPREVDNA